MEKRYRASEIILDAWRENMEAAAGNDRLGQYLIHKASHTFKVAGLAMEILESEPVLEWLPRQEKENAALAAILHDLGRFYQHRNGRVLKSTEFDHGRESARRLEEAGEFDDPLILFSIEEHNKPRMNLSNPHYAAIPEIRRPAAESAAKLLRDADKLENINDFCFYGVWRGREIHKAPMSDKAREKFASGAQVLYADAENDTDHIVAVLAWLDDINFDYTRQAAKERGYVEACLKEMEKTGASVSDIELARKRYGSA